MLEKTTASSDLIETLEQMDWGFNSSNTKKTIHNIHPYPAKFIPELPKQLIKSLGVKGGGAVMDPFCGSGTSLVVAQELGYKSIGIDLNPIACLISKVKTQPVPGNIAEVATRLAADSLSSSPSLSEVRKIPNIDHWFMAEIQTRVLALKKEISKINNDLTKDILNLCLSSILVRVSNQDSDTRYAAVEKNIAAKDVTTHFLNAVSNLVKAKVSQNSEKEANVIYNDILAVKKEDIREKVGLVITSPPYPNAYEYWLYHKYRMFWLDFDPLAVKEREIGARAHFFKKNHHTEENFYHQMKGTLSLLKEVMLDGAYAAFVVGRSKIHGKIVNNAEIIKNAALDIGMDYHGELTRTIKSNRKAFNLSHANIKQEEIVILQK